MAANTGLLDMDSASRAFIDFLEAEGYIGPRAVDPMSINKQRDLYNLLFKPSYNGNTSFSFHDIHRHMLTHNLMRQEGNKWAFPTKAGITVPNTSKSPKRNQEPQRRRIAIDQRLAIQNSRKNKSRKGVPLSFLSANIQDYEANAGGILDSVVWPSIVFLSNTGLNKDVADEDLIWSGYNSCRRAGTSGDGDLLLYYLSHLQLDSLDELQSNQLDVLWVKLTDSKVVVSDPRHRVTILGNVYGKNENRGQMIKYLEQTLVSIKERFGDVDVILQGSGNTSQALKALKKFGLVSHIDPTLHDSGFFLTSVGMSVQSVKEINYEENSEYKPILAQMEKTRCVVCQVEFRRSAELRAHQDTGRHHRNHCFNLYQRKRQEMITSPHHLGLEIGIVNEDTGVAMSSDEPGLVVIQTAPGIVKSFSVAIKNVSGEMFLESKDKAGNKDKAGIVISAIDFLKTDPVFKISDKYDLSNRERDGEAQKIRIPNGVKYKAEITCHAKQRGHYKVPLIVTFYHDLKSSFITENKKIEGEDVAEKRFELAHMAIEVLLMVQTEDMRELKPKAPYERPKPVAKWKGNEKSVEKAPKPPKVEDVPQEERLARTVELKHYGINASRQRVLTHGMEIWADATQADREQKSKCDNVLSGSLTSQNYKERLELLLHCEEHQLQYDIHHYDMNSVEMVRRKSLMELKVPGLAENRPSVLKNDKLFIRQGANGQEYEGIVYEVGENEVRLGCSDRLVRNHVNGMKYDVRFTLNRFPLRNMHRAVTMAETEGIIPFLFPTTKHFRKPAELPNIKPMDRLLADNSEQMLAVQHIVAGSSGGAPYLVFGPPGTGKTVTLVEAIKQINRMDPSSRILATAPSNAAADLLASRLIKHVPHSQLLRLHAPSRIHTSIPEDVLGVSNLNRGSLSFAYPTVEVLAKYRVLVVTLVTAGRLVSGSFPKGHFTHVFIDEAGHAMEPEAVIPLAGVIHKETVDLGKASIILAGDPKQLGPVLRSPWAIKHGLGTSLLERLMNQDMYGGNSGVYDNRCITKLVRNFRSHEKLLRLPAQLFYNGQLEAAADELVVNSLLKWPGLPKPGFPMLFHGIVGQDLREERSPSFFNLEEVCTVVEYIEDLLSTREFGIRVQQKEIGVISPYRRQVQKIRAKLASKQLYDITVGSTEEFQGQERRVMIVSTVRSSPEFVRMDTQYRLGFLRNPKRFNVAITRAKALLIVVGNPHILSQDNDWKALITYAMEEGGYVGCHYAEEEDEAIDAMAVRLGNILQIQDDNLMDISYQTAMEEPQWRSDV